MSRKPARFTQAEAARLLRAIVQTGVPMILQAVDGVLNVVPLPANAMPSAPSLAIAEQPLVMLR